jgi:hypothetical protein
MSRAPLNVGIIIDEIQYPPQLIQRKLTVICEIHAHRQQKLEALRRKHSHVFGQLDSVREELYALSAELNGLTERDVSL